MESNATDMIEKAGNQPDPCCPSCAHSKDLSFEEDPEHWIRCEAGHVPNQGNVFLGCLSFDPKTFEAI
jgi:hypothetical protein